MAVMELAESEKPGAASKLARAPTLVAVTALQSGDPAQDREDTFATAVAAYIVLLGAHARGLAGYWRTPAVLRTPEGRAAVGIGDRERAIGLIHLGRPRQDKPPPDRLATDDYVSYLD